MRVSHSLTQPYKLAPKRPSIGLKQPPLRSSSPSSQALTFIDQIKRRRENMVTSTSSSSSCSSINSFDDLSFTAASKPVKFLCSHRGKILPRYPDGKLRYVGGETRVLAVPRSIPFSDLQAQMMKLCGSESPVVLRCQLPTEELDDALVSITSDEDLANLFEEYDLAGRDRLKIRAFLFPQPTNSHASSSSPPPPVRREYTARPPLPVVARRCVHQITRQHQTMRNRLR